MELLSHAGMMFIFRWLHYFLGVIWIGLLYYFNFVQGPFFAETDAATKSNAIQKLLPRALWWFRWGAMFTFITGLMVFFMTFGPRGADSLRQPWGILILTGMTLGTLMWANVWFIIWPNQKIVIASATQAAQGKPAIPEAAAAGARAMVASRTNTLFSIPMLFFMGAASHVPFMMSMNANLTGLASSIAFILGLLELNAMSGKTGPMTTVKGVIHCGLALTVVLWVVIKFWT
jgi:uncharacterized membrane protein